MLAGDIASGFSLCWVCRSPCVRLKWLTHNNEDNSLVISRATQLRLSHSAPQRAGYLQRGRPRPRSAWAGAGHIPCLGRGLMPCLVLPQSRAGSVFGAGREQCREAGCSQLPAERWGWLSFPFYQESWSETNLNTARCKGAWLWPTDV